MEYDSGPLPDGILLDILSRLPVKSLFRCKSVCRQWRHWISTPQFIKLHLSFSQLTTSTHHRQRRRVAILMSRDPPASVALLSVDTETYSDQSVIELCNDFKYSYPNAMVWNSCNGLVLLSISDKTFFAWNPSTRNHELVSHIPPSSPRRPRYFLIGLGYDRLSDEYKVIGAFQHFRSSDDCLMFCSSLEATSNKSRITKIDFPYRIYRDTPGTVVDGDLYWMVNSDPRCPVIIYFDFVAEVFVEMTQPTYDSESGISKYGLGVLSGSLCVVCHREYNVEVLGFKKCGTIESWARLFVIPYDVGGLQFKTLTPLCFTNDGEVMMEIDRKSLVVYNIEEKTYRLLSHLPSEVTDTTWETQRIRQVSRLNGSGFKVLVYVESLVSPSSASKSMVNLSSTVQQQLRLG